ncbi:MAG: hypothetical protein AAGF95_29940 [Chloroflexota bacterium]
MNNYDLSYEVAQTRQAEILREADQDRLAQNYPVQRSFVRKISRLVGYGFVHIGVHLLRYGRVERFTILRTHPAQPESIQSN